jgi:hypothetical protein
MGSFAICTYRGGWVGGAACWGSETAVLNSSRADTRIMCYVVSVERDHLTFDETSWALTLLAQT